MTQVTGTIRQRGQLTIPDTIRKNRAWTAPGSAITIISNKTDEITIRPYSLANQVDWNQLWKQMKRVRAFKGKGKGNLSQFIAEDRETRR